MYAVTSAHASQPVVPLMASYELTSQFSVTPASSGLNPITSLLPATLLSKQTPIPKKPIATVIERPANYISPTVAPTITPTVTSSIVSTNMPQASTTVAVPQNSGGLNPDVLFGMVNQYRTENGLPVFEKNDAVCSLAVSRAPEISGEIASGHMHAGMYARNLPYWNTENIITMRTEAEAFNWWKNDYIHRIQMLGNYKYSCLACSGNACAEEFTNLTPK